MTGRTNQPVSFDSLPLAGSCRVGTTVGNITVDSALEIPFCIIESGRPGPRLLVTAGVHGAEFGAVAAASQLISAPPEILCGSILVLPILNVRGFYARTPFCMPEDNRNLNHVFPGASDGSVSERLAAWLVSTAFPGSDAYIDLHNGDIVEDLVPFTIFPAGSEASCDLAKVFGLGLALASPGTGFAIEAATRLGIPAIIAEIGGNGLWTTDHLAVMRRGLDRVLASLGMTAAPLAAAPNVRLIEKWDPKAPVSGLWYPQKALLDMVAEGDVLGVIADVFGRPQHTILADRPGFVLYRLTSLAANQGDALMGIARDWPPRP